uniref:Uncharacterized protein n=1 Tax=Cyclophora tenuis TaxID=216820 RepID=A0A7S1D5S1_CYCTE|mmetsp:Transcript_21605/g.36788  ORF Transcript_21605/g.36788 Transcript_21605/m.36788 type:complete len:170 (+) Transcript_21605:24-533(+)
MDKGGYTFVEQNEKEVAILQAPHVVVELDNDDTKTKSPTTKADDKDDDNNNNKSPSSLLFTKAEVRGAGVGGGVVGLVLGGPILAIVGGVVAANVAKTNTEAGKFCRNHGQRISRWVIQACDWIKDKMQPDKKHPQNNHDNDNNDEAEVTFEEIKRPTATIPTPVKEIV